MNKNKPDRWEYRSRLVKTFFTILNVKYVPELATYLDNVGAEIVEDLKNLDDSDWDEIKSIIRLKKLQERKLNAAIKYLNLGEYDHKIAQSLPIDASNDNGGNMKKNQTKRKLHLVALLI